MQFAKLNELKLKARALQFSLGSWYAFYLFMEICQYR